MNFVKGYRFHPTDVELIEYLQIKTFDRDSLVQVIDEVQDICESEPWELPGRSGLQTRDGLWYFMYPTKYKYRNSKLVSRTTMKGYWKPTGDPRDIIDPDTGVVIGSKKTLVFYKGRCKNKEKTCWVIHEYELKNDTSTSVSVRKTYNLCKLKKKTDISSTKAARSEKKKAARSSQHSLSGSENHEANNAMSEEPLHLKKVSTEQNRPNEKNWVHNSCRAIEQDDASCNSILTMNDETVPIEKSNQHNQVVAAEGVQMPSNLDFLADGDGDLVPMDFFYNNGTLDGLLEEPEATNNSDCIQKNITNMGYGDFLNPVFADNNEAYIREGNGQQFLAADNEGFNLPCMGMEESSNYMEKSRKRPRLEYDGLSHNVETGVAQPWGEEHPYTVKSIQAGSSNIVVTPSD
ncbi:hypothetical protein DITRI_Ditri13aG0118900 [Diplodiscus trichospermus]